MNTLSTRVRTALAEEYWVTGYVVVRGRFSCAEVEGVQRECMRLFSLFSEEHDRHNLRVQFRAHERGRPILDRIDPIRDLSPPLGDLAQDPRILETVAEVFGEPGLLFKDKLILKAPGTHGYRAHQDYTNWQETPVHPDALLSVLFAVDDSSPLNGGLEFFPRLHHKHHLDARTPSDIFDPKTGLTPSDVLAGHSPVSSQLQAGDLILFHSLTPHQSGVNHSKSTRCAIFYSYAPASCGDLYKTYYQSFYGYLRKDRAAESGLLFLR